MHNLNDLSTFKAKFMVLSQYDLFHANIFNHKVRSCLYKMTIIMFAMALLKKLKQGCVKPRRRKLAINYLTSKVSNA